MNRRGYLDWLRGLAVLVMIECHTLDAWTRGADRTDFAYRWAMVVGGFGAPMFLFLAGVAMALAAGARRRRGLTEPETARLAMRRGWQVLGLAFLFRLQAWVISQGPFADTLLKVDILNVMGVAMLCGASAFALTRSQGRRALLLAAAAAGVALVTPVVRTSAWVAALPTYLAWYFRPEPGWTTFTLFPWIAFLLAGAAVGLWLDTARTPAAERRVNVWLATVGPGLAIIGYAMALLPPAYSEVSFWSTSPTFFLLRLGIVTTLVPAAFAWNASHAGSSPLRRLGVASLFVYWIHVELVYGVPSMMIHRQLTFVQALAGYVIVSALMYGLVILKDRRWKYRLRPEPTPAR